MLNSERPLALVTGAGRRLGKAIALRLAQAGYAIGLHYHHSREAAEQTRMEIEQTTGMPVYLLEADLCDPQEITAMFAGVSRLPQRLAVLVNSAGRMRKSSAVDVSLEEWEETLALNLRAPLLCAQAAARMMPRPGGVIINISDVGARKTWPAYAAYSVSKAGLETLTRLLARGLAPDIRVNAVAPGLILPPDAGGDEQNWQRLVERVPLRRSGTPLEITEAVLFLIQNAYITGEILTIDGGYQAV